MRPVLLIALLVVGVAQAAKPKRERAATPRRPVPAAGSSSVGPGQVTFVTTTTAYLDRGAVDGLAVGDAHTVTRAGRLVGRCTIATVAQSWATCNVQGMQVGDRLGAVVRALARPPGAQSPVADPEQLLARRQVIEAVELPLVDFAGAGGGLLSSGTRLASLAISHSSWANFGSTEGPFQIQRIDVGAYDVPIWRGLHGSADLTVLNFGKRPLDFKSPLRGSPVLLVRQLEISYHSADLPLIAAIGRTWTRHTPGLLMVDGVQAGWRNRDDSVEVGAYGGLLPDPVSLGVSTQRFTVGTFAMARFESGKGSHASLLQLEAHLGYAVRGLVPGRLEIGAALHTWVTRAFDAHLLLEVGALGAEAPGLIDGVRLDLGWRPVEVLRISAGGRYQGTSPTDTLELGVTLRGQRALHADAAVTLELSPSLWLALTGGTSFDFPSALNQTRFGPELTLPHVLGQAVSLGVGYQEDLGWIRGRTAWLQLSVVPFTRLRILARGSWFQQQVTGLAGHELGAALIVDLVINRWAWVRLTSLGRAQVAGATPAAGGPLGGTVMGQLGGQL